MAASAVWQKRVNIYHARKAAMEAETEFEISRAQLAELLRDLREAVTGTLWAIL